jgi:hypothetical protein
MKNEISRQQLTESRAVGLEHNAGYMVFCSAETPSLDIRQHRRRRVQSLSRKEPCR